MELNANMPLARPPMPPATTAPVFCKDCKHFNDKVPKSPPVCMAPMAQTINLVYGPQPNGCADTRSDRNNGACGHEGKLFAQTSPDSIASVTNGVSNTV